MTASALLALVVVLNGATTSTTSPPVTMPAADCLAAESAIWQLPAETVAKSPEGDVPAVDAYCVDLDALQR